MLFKRFLLFALLCTLTTAFAGSNNSPLDFNCGGDVCRIPVGNHNKNIFSTIVKKQSVKAKKVVKSKHKKPHAK